MESAEGALEIVICLGSSCFARGNGDHLATIKAHIENNKLEGRVRLSGLLCQDQCKLGPNVTIDGEVHHRVTSDQLNEQLKRLATLQGQSNGKD